MSFCINKSGAAFGVYDSYITTQIGTIYPNECFSVTSRVKIPGQNLDKITIRFRGPNGTLMDGATYTNNGAETYSIVDNYSFGGGTTTTGYHYNSSLKARSYLNIYDYAGNLTSYCYAGCKVLTSQNTTGQNYPQWLLINAVERPAGSGIYYPVGAGGKDYAFINTGLEYGSMSSNIGLYGNW